MSARTKYIRSTAPVGRDFPTLIPPLHLEPGEVVRVGSHVDLPEVEAATAKDYEGDGEAQAHVLPPEPTEADDVREPRVIEPGSDDALAFPPDSLIRDETEAPVVDEPVVEDTPETVVTEDPSAPTG